ncbi:MAG: SDR family oxidoreductase [Treponema sp.]|jgi:NAD(P)-dependent dehydrogenase (short-subunit alcohol dehydrogenase family)|nr:SDR family oxidoreductase [Treponema sp.]
MYSFHEGYQKVLGIDLDGLPNMTAGVKNLKSTKDILDLSGKTAIVTGGAMGMGFCTVNRLCEAGASVVIADVAAEYAEKNLEYLSSKGYKAKFVKTDVRYPDQIQAAVDFTVKQFGSIDILVNNAGVWNHRLLHDITEETWYEIMDINLKGTVFFVKAVAPVMETQGRGGKIVNISSIAGIPEDPAPIMLEYVASKSGVLAVTKSLVRAMKPIGVNINCVIPGGMLTPGACTTSGTEEAKNIREALPPSPVADPDEVARVVFMLTTHISDYMHGATVLVDGGCCLGM